MNKQVRRAARNGVPHLLYYFDMSTLRWGVTLLAYSLLAACGSSGSSVPLKTGLSENETPSPTSLDFPARDCANFEVLVSVGWLKSLLDFNASPHSARRPETYHNQRFVVLEASWAKTEAAKAYLAGHIPGAIHFNTDDLENGSPRWKLLEPEQLQQVFGRNGITPDTTVVVYGEQLIAAARVWWALKYAGVIDVRLLDGGFAAWKAAGYSAETAIQTPLDVVFEGPVFYDILATTEYVRENLDRSAIWLADVRSTAEFVGRKSGYQYLDAKGRIPGALHAGDADDSSYLYKQPDGRLRSPANILAIWQEQGIVSTKAENLLDREVVFYCGGGWRSSLAFFYAWLMGFKNVRNYSAGWSEWSTDYVADSTAAGSTPGWRQVRTRNPIEKPAN